MSVKDTKKVKLYVPIVYSVAFYTIWSIYEFFGKPILNSLIENEAAAMLIKSGVIKNLAWTLPAALLVHHFRSEVYISLKEMFTTKVKWLRYLPIFLIFTAYNLLTAFVVNGKLAIVESFGMDDIILILFVGLTEEMVFRGWLLNATLREDKKWLCVGINALMFLAIHFPRWICDGIFISYFAGLGFIGIIVLGIIFSWSFIKSRNIFVPIVLHMYWDLLSFMLLSET